ncbi:molybdenum cofactor guanylyltransferase MobA [Paracoccus sp. XHP0099]|uniref:Molybdenum cofactor guanylyltransferase n=2 Tax=Paracoccus marinaquae TaxID=2841926 RepID=A0ABS6AHE2_9RHOB|nr:molybdenum cofactor guanylyltransferase MobA [Paracoccus marinaquae]MBU3030013.1 molybdenum cofactor guanylyltransferase MobA [Paracoccus marinaquae]
MTKLPAIVLAGGHASRMGGGDKGLLRLGGQSLLARVIARLGPQCAPLALSANDDPARFAGFGLPVLADSIPDRPGPLAGILAGLDWAARLGAPALVSAATDAPFLPPDLAARLAEEAGPRGLAMAATRHPDRQVIDHPVFALWPVSLRDELRAALLAGQRRVRSFAAAHEPGLAIWEAGAVDPFFNVNTPADLARAEGLAASFRAVPGS